MRYAVISGVSVVAAAAASFFMEPIFPLGDWRWLVIAGIGSLAAWLLWFTGPKRLLPLRVSHDGRKIAKRIRRARNADYAEAIYESYRKLPPEVRQFSEEAERGYWMWLEEHDPEHALRFATRRLKMPLRDVMRHRVKRTGERYDRARLPPWRRAWARLRATRVR